MAPSSASDDAILSKLFALEFSLKGYAGIILATYLPPFLLGLVFAFLGVFKYPLAIAIIFVACFTAFYYSPEGYEGIAFFTFLFLLGETLILMSTPLNSLLVRILGIIIALSSLPFLVWLADTDEKKSYMALFLSQTSFMVVVSLLILGFGFEAFFILLLSLIFLMIITDTGDALPVAVGMYIYYAVLFWPLRIESVLASNSNKVFEVYWYRRALKEKKVIAGTKYELLERIKIESSFERWRAINKKTKEELFVDVPVHTLGKIDLFVIYGVHEYARVWNELASHLNNLLYIKDYSGRNRRLPFVVFLPVGEPLSKIATGRVNYYYVEHIARKIVSTVSCLHKIGITNINLTPENIFIVDSEPKICGRHLNAFRWIQIDPSLERVLERQLWDPEVLFVLSDKRLDILQLCDILEDILIKPYINDSSTKPQARKFLRNLLSAIERFRKTLQWDSIDEFPYLKDLDDSDRKPYRSIVKSLRRIMKSDPYLSALHACANNNCVSALDHILKIRDRWKVDDALRHLTLCFIRNEMFLPALIAANVVNYKKLRQYLLIVTIHTMLRYGKFDALIRFLNSRRIEFKKRKEVGELIINISKMKNITIPKEFVESLEDPKIKKLYLKST